MGPNEIFGIEDDGKTAGMCSYFFIFGWTVSYFGYHQTIKTSHGSFHLRQTLLLYIAYVAIRYGVLSLMDRTGLSYGLFSADNLAIVVNATFIFFWIFGLISAINGQKKAIPVLGRVAQNMFPAI